MILPRLRAIRSCSCAALLAACAPNEISRLRPRHRSQPSPPTSTPRCKPSASARELPARIAMIHFVDLATATVPNMPYHGIPLQLVAMASEPPPPNPRSRAVCAVVEQESDGTRGPCVPSQAFFAKYVARSTPQSRSSASEPTPDGFSWGLMQVMGQVAREHGFDSPIPHPRCATGTGSGDRLQSLVENSTPWRRTPHRGLLAWNAGANLAYPAQVLTANPTYS